MEAHYAPLVQVRSHAQTARAALSPSETHYTIQTTETALTIASSMRAM